MSAVAELEASLQAMLNLKPPGVSGSRIAGITALCVNNVQSESVLIQKLYTHFKKTPGTHKLGVLYVVDSVTRKWLEQAKSQGQPINGAAQDGTYAAGVHRVTELMPVLMNDILSSGPEDQKEKIKKLVDIWEKGQTFPAPMLESFKQRLNAPPPPKFSTTPPGSPPPDAALSGANTKPPAAAGMSNIMQTLANLARQNNSAAAPQPPIPPPAQSGAYNPPVPPSNPTQQSLPQALAQFLPPIQQPQQSQTAPPVNPLAGLPFPPPPNLQPPQGQAAATNPLLALLGQANGFAQAQPPPVAAPAPSPAPAPASGVDPKIQQQLLLIQTLAAQGVPVETITAILGQLSATNAAPGQLPPPQAPTPVSSAYLPPVAGGNNQQSSSYGGSWAPPPQSRADESRDRDGHYRDPMRSPNRFRNGRSRSRSPQRRWDQSDSPRNGRDHGRNSPGRRDGGHDSYRQRSPPGGRPDDDQPPPQKDKWVEYDSSLPSGTIKVLSRTLFVGGVTSSDAELRGVFARYGPVQTCIVNREKRHAFVKMYFRNDAVRAKEGMEEARSHDMPLRTRWGVGFGPRDCSDYATGISVIPISKLTEADRKWMLTAEYGGSGGRPIVSGICVEEPDIEIGAGVSSKAISRRMQTDKGGSHGPKSSRRDEDVNDIPIGGGNGNGAGARWRGGRRDGNSSGGAGGAGGVQTEHVVPELPFGLTMGPNGMPIFPPGFSFPAPDAMKQ